MILIGDNPQLTLDFYQDVIQGTANLAFAVNATEVFEQAIAREPDLIILNANLFGEAVYRLCINIKQHHQLTQALVIITNVNNEVENKSRGFRSGADDVITQPTDKFELSQRIKKQLSSQKLRQLQRRQNKSLKRTIKRQKALSFIISRIRRSLDLDSIFCSTASEIHYALTCDRVVIYRFNEDWSGKFVAEAVSPQWRSLLENPSPKDQEIKQTSARHADNGDCLIQLFEEERTDWVQDTYFQVTKGGIYKNNGVAYRAVDNIYQAGFSDCYLDLLETFQAKAYVVLPIFLGKRLWGLLGIYQNDGPRQWQPEEKEMLLQIASQLGIALQQANLLKELREAKEKAESASRAKGLFLANMSHELRTPLSAILGFSELLSNDPDLSVDQLDSLECIYRSGKYLLDLINDVLSLSQIEAGKLTLNPESFELSDSLNLIKNIVEIAATQKHLTLTFQLNHNLPRYIYLDRAKFKQILLNLLSNAIKFTETGEVTLRMEKRSLAYQQCGLYVEIIDTGPGIAPEEQAILFQSFQQTTSGRQSKQGTGLGLAISQSFVQIMGGQIQVESVLGQGSRFWFELPIEGDCCQTDALTEADIHGQPSMIAPKVSLEREADQQAKVLVIEDHPAQRELLQVQLEELGFLVAVADDGSQGIELWRSWQPDLILLDLRMPSVDGATVIQEINRAIAADVNYKQPKIIVITADIFYAQENLEELAGCDAIMYKPVNSEQLFKTINSYFADRITKAALK